MGLRFKVIVIKEAVVRVGKTVARPWSIWEGL